MSFFNFLKRKPAQASSSSKSQQSNTTPSAKNPPIESNPHPPRPTITPQTKNSPFQSNPLPPQPSIPRISPEDYFIKYLIFFVRSKKNDQQSSEDVIFESFQSLAPGYLEQLASNNVPGAVQEAGERCLFSVMRQNADVGKAIEYFEKSAALGHPDAYGMLSQIYREPKYGRMDYRKYFQVLEDGAQRGSWMCMINLASAYYKGRQEFNGFGYDIDKAKTYFWNEQAIDMLSGLLALFLNNPHSANFEHYVKNLFSSYVRCVCQNAQQLISGNGIPQNPAEAKLLLQKSSDFCEQFFHGTPRDFTVLLNQISSL